MNVIRIATRQSKLALWQANFIKARLEAAHPQLKVELHGITTKGDKWLQAPLSEVGGKGLFVKELETAMLAGEAHIAVHSAKDLPALLPDGFTLPVLGFREAVEDVLIGAGSDLNSTASDPFAVLAQGATVGSSSLRRKAQMLAKRPDLNVVPIRGNVDTRLAKLDAGEFDAIVLAQAGLNRLLIQRSDIQVLPAQLCLPAPGQGALGVECISGSVAEELLQPLVDADTAACVAAERAISAGLGADCSLPVAAHAVLQGDQIFLKALLCNADGTQIIRAEQRGDCLGDRIAGALDLAGLVLQDLYAQGAQTILDGLRV